MFLHAPTRLPRTSHHFGVCEWYTSAGDLNGPIIMKVATKLVLLTTVAGVGAFIGGLYIHRRYIPQPLPVTAMIGTAESDANDLRYRLHTRLSATEKQHLFDGKCQVVTSTGALPIAIRNAFATVTQVEPFALANPGTRFNVTDVIEPDLPSRRLVFAGVCENRWLIQYEKGGIGYSVEVLVLRLESNGDVHFMWGGVGSRPAASLTALQVAIVSGRFGDAVSF